MEKEYLELFDEIGNKTGESILRTSKFILPKNRFIMTVIVFIINSKNEILIQKTSKNREDIYATTGGHVKTGSNSLTSIKEELKEELNLDILDDELTFLAREKLSYKYQDIYLLKKDILLKKIKLQESEVEDIMWLKKEEIEKLIEKNLFRKSNINGFNLLKAELIKK